MGWYYYRRNGCEDNMISIDWNVEELLQHKRLDGAPTNHHGAFHCRVW